MRNNKKMNVAEYDSKRESAVESSDSVASPTISVDQLEKVYGTGESAVHAVEDVSFDVEPGTVVGLLGPNGAGKTTTIKAMLGLVVPSAGSVRLNGVDPHTNPQRAYEEVGAMLEGARNVYWRLTVGENLEFFDSLAGHARGTRHTRHEELLEQFGLTADTTVNDLSRGMKQKVSVACTLVRETPIVFLDEPTLGLDVESSIELQKELTQLAEHGSRTVVLSSHDMDVVEAVCDRVIIMNEGQIVADDAPSDLLRLFETQAYRMTVAGELSSTAKRRLEREYGADGFEQTGGRESFSVSFADNMRLYALLETLSGEQPLVSVAPVEPDFEDVFLELTTEET